MLLFKQNYSNILVYTIKVTYAYASSVCVCGGGGVGREWLSAENIYLLPQKEIETV
jgi:hypothetical protein